MPGLSGSPLLQRTIDVQYASRKRAAATKWSLLNGTLLLIFAYDLWCKCPGYTSTLHVVELCVATTLAASLLLHIRWLLPSRERALDVTAEQLHLLGLSDQQLDSSFRLVDTSGPPSPRSDASLTLDDDVSALSLSLSQSRGGGGGGSPGSAGGDASWSRGGAALHEDQFIADSDSLTDYLRQYSERAAAQTPPTPAWLASGGSVPGVAAGAGAAAAARARHYQLSSLEAPAPAEAGAGGSPRVWTRLDLDPQQLTQYNLNLRLWLHVTILARLVREVDSINEALHKHHLPDVTIGEVSVERLRRTAAALGGGGGGGASLGALLPYLEPFPEQRYLLQRIRELSSGGCLGQYKWDRGGSDWDDTKPTDSEIIFHLFSTYMESQFGDGVGGGAAGAVGAPRVVRAAPAAPPPHYLLQLKDETVEVCRGRNNLLHTLLVWVAAAAAAAAARGGARLQLGPAGLNLLWVIGR